MVTRSAAPSAISASAVAGALILLVVQSGMDTLPFIFLVTHAKAPRGTMVAMVGTRASCQPMPVLMMDAPAASICCASSTTSGQAEPPVGPQGPKGKQWIVEDVAS